MNKLWEGCHWALTHFSHLKGKSLLIQEHLERDASKHQFISCNSNIICRIMLAFIFICVLFILIPSWFRILLVFRKHAGMKKSIKQQVVVCDISSASLKRNCPFKSFKSLTEISIYLMLLIKNSVGTINSLRLVAQFGQTRRYFIV